jgi:hypothetical protein
MALPPKKDQVIAKSDASRITANFRKSTSTAAIKGLLFWNESLQKAMAQKGCVALRFYYAQKDDGTSALVVSGVDQEGNDIEAGVLVEEGLPCPPYCSTPGALNS